ncbi:DUF6146 family protein [Flavobacteriaceae bacterium S0825]|uniref:DUF6146 family protein n=1 Tax=Gaetbulibacter sp. S0825 TaxID=2720084 RepID=UPI0014312E08|nr:DUF6146 family protein [Gaetbulibacter sp. S0825]MCK0109672.1 DUF6146 family protein [Flavobacteriaceae bacterium S0825]NIX65305.1 hypothetical protein [Gaetbulibacter sp. S0825]
MKNLFLIFLICFGVISCKTSQKANVSNQVSEVEQDTVRIANDKLEYEIIIIEPGFSTWLLSTAKPEGYYSQEFLESRNQMLVSEWNSRVLQPNRYSPSLYEARIDYEPNIDYGYEVNYKLYNYFIYFQITHKQQLTGFTPRI